MILYFSGTGNSLAISREIAVETGDRVMAMGEESDLRGERRVGLVYPCYWFNAPRAVMERVRKMEISREAYVFIVISCGAQAGNAIWSVRKVLEEKGVEVAYSNKLREPDNSAIGFGRNPNEQGWKFEKYAGRMKSIAMDVAREERKLRYGWWGPIGALCGGKRMQGWTLPMLTPKVSEEKCVGCGICAGVCPQGNIKMEGGKARCGGECTQCLACVHFCPHQAMELGKRGTPKEHQYHHPGVTMRDLMRGGN